MRHVRSARQFHTVAVSQTAAILETPTPLGPSSPQQPQWKNAKCITDELESSFWSSGILVGNQTGECAYARCIQSRNRLKASNIASRRPGIPRPRIAVGLGGTVQKTGPGRGPSPQSIPVDVRRVDYAAHLRA